MRKENKNYFGIYINNKVPKLDNKINKYYRNIKLDFEGEAFIVESENSDTQQRLESKKKYKKTGKHIIKFVDKNKKTYYINIKISKLYLLWLFLLSFLILLSYIMFFNNDFIYPKQLFEQFINYDVELEGLKYVFNINYKNADFQSIELTDKVNKNNFIYPGSYGSFYVVISTKGGNKDMFYKMQVKEEIRKPRNLKFKVNNNIYNSMEELAEDITGTISKNSSKSLKIDWFWDYDTNDDIADTFDAINIKNYKFLMSIIGSTEGG